MRRQGTGRKERAYNEKEADRRTTSCQRRRRGWRMEKRITGKGEGD